MYMLGTVFKVVTYFLVQIYFHCDLRICPLGDCPLSTNCGGSRRRRDIAGSNLVVSKHVSAGPIKLHHSASVGKKSKCPKCFDFTLYRRFHFC